MFINCFENQMCIKLQIIVLVGLQVFSIFVEPTTLNENLKSWSIISESDLKQSEFFHGGRNKRSTNGRKVAMFKKVTVPIFGKPVKLILYPYQDLLSPSIKIKFFGENKERFSSFDRNKLLEGHIEGSADSEAVAVLEEDKKVISIWSGNETYFVEPLNMHTNNSSSEDLIVYKMSDVNFNTSHESFCGSTHLKPNRSRTIKSRLRSRQARTGTVCSLHLTVDHRFYQRVTHSNDAEVVYIIFQHIANVNKHFERTAWFESEEDKSAGSGLSFQIERLDIFKDPTDELFNSKKGTEVGKPYLISFSKAPNKQCLSHVFTFTQFENGLLGLAYVAEISQSHGAGGGICAYPDPRLTKPVFYNVGMSSFNLHNRLLLSAESLIVTLHEFGHNFGSVHDEETAECAPGQDGGGNFVMYPGAVSGKFHNNMKFSPCSIRSVSKVIENPMTIACFQEKRVAGSFCGDFFIDPDEQCDAGFKVEGASNEDRCCDEKCKLRGEAKCSPFNYACCNTNCQVSSSSVVCRNRNPGQCQEQVNCNGVHFACPEPVFVKDGTPCGSSGTCKGGKCQSLCEFHGFQHCFCTSPPFMCLHCCAPAVVPPGVNITTLCRPFRSKEGTNIKLKENAACVHGYCMSDVCVPVVQDFVTKVQTVFKELKISFLIEAMKNNLVGGLAVIALVVWLPMSYLVHTIDKKASTREDESVRYLDEISKYYPHIEFTTEHGFNLRRSTGIPPPTFQNKEAGESDADQQRSGHKISY